MDNILNIRKVTDYLIRNYSIALSER